MRTQNDQNPDAGLGLSGSSASVLPSGGMAQDRLRRMLDLAWKENICSLSTGLTHDLCNLMTGIVSLSEALLGNRPTDEPARTSLTRIRDTALQAGQLAQRFHRLKQDAPGQKSFLDLNQELSSHAALLQKLLSRRFSIQTVLEPSLGNAALGQLPVEADPIELRQVILSLVLDAARALPGGCHFVFRTARLESPPANLTFSAFCPESGKPLAQLSFQAGETGSVVPCAALDPPSLRDSFLSSNPETQSGLSLLRAMLFAERHSGALSVSGTCTTLLNSVALLIPLATLAGS